MSEKDWNSETVNIKNEDQLKVEQVSSAKPLLLVQLTEAELTADPFPTWIKTSDLPWSFPSLRMWG